MGGDALVTVEFPQSVCYLCGGWQLHDTLAVIADATSKTCRHASQLAGHVSQVTGLYTSHSDMFLLCILTHAKIPTLSHPCIVFTSLSSYLPTVVLSFTGDPGGEVWEKPLVYRPLLYAICYEPRSSCLIAIDHEFQSLVTNHDL